MCARCEELEAEVVWLKSELALTSQADTWAPLRDYMMAHVHAGRGGGRSGLTCGRTQASKFLAALYAAGGKTLTNRQLLERVPPVDHVEDDRDKKIVAVWACLARESFGFDAVKTMWGVGYRITEVGRARVDAILQHREAA